MLLCNSCRRTISRSVWAGISAASIQPQVAKQHIRRSTAAAYTEENDTPAEERHPAQIASPVLNFAKHDAAIQRLARASDQKEEAMYLANDAIAFGLLDDMQRQGLHPSRRTAEALLHIACIASNHNHVYRILELFRQYWIPFSEATTERVVLLHCQNDAPERCRSFIDSQMKSGYKVSSRAWAHYILMCIRLNESAAAHQALRDVDAVFKADRRFRIDHRVYYEALNGFADNYNIGGLQYAWSRAAPGKILSTIDVNLCTKILRVCGRAGLPILATEVLQYLGKKKIQPASYHYTFLIQSYCRAGDVKTALTIFPIMREQGFVPDSNTAAPILEFISTDLELIDRTFFTLQDIKSSGGHVDVAAFNALLDACALRKDAARAVATYQEHASLGVLPTVDTLNSLLTACVGTYSKDLAFSLLSTFKTLHKVQPNRDTYTRIIAICMIQEDYEDGFLQLEEMKSAGYQPQEPIYNLIIHRCAIAKDPRARVALDEYRGWGYKEDTRLLNAVRSISHQEARYTMESLHTGVFDRLRAMTESDQKFLAR